MQQSGPRSSRAEKTREAILSAAENLFAEKGFAATRLKDVAEVVGIRRASIVYYFRDKPELYGAVLDSLVQDLYLRVEVAFDRRETLIERIEGAVSAFIDFLAARPAAGHILLREIASGSPGRPPELLHHFGSFPALAERVRSESGGYPKADPIQIASAIAGTSVFQLVAVPALLPGNWYDPRQPERLEALRADVLAIARRLLGELEDG